MDGASDSRREYKIMISLEAIEEEKKMEDNHLLMDTETFWDLIEKMNGKYSENLELGIEWLREKLEELPPEQVAGFICLFWSYREAANKYGLWSAAIVMKQECSIEEFMKFRTWLISQGKDIYMEVLKNPDFLVDIKVPKLSNFEELSCVGNRVYMKRTGKDWYEAYFPDEIWKYQQEVEKQIVYHPLIEYPLEIKGLKFAFPKLCKRYNIQELMYQGKIIWDPEHERPDIRKLKADGRWMIKEMKEQSMKDKDPVR